MTGDPGTKVRAITFVQWVVFLLSCPIIAMQMQLRSTWKPYNVLDHLQVILTVGALVGFLGLLKRHIQPGLMLLERRLALRATMSLAQLVIVNVASTFGLLTCNLAFGAPEENSSTSRILRWNSCPASSIVSFLLFAVVSLGPLVVAMEWAKRLITSVAVETYDAPGV